MKRIPKRFKDMTLQDFDDYIRLLRLEQDKFKNNISNNSYEIIVTPRWNPVSYKESKEILRNPYSQKRRLRK